MNVLTRKFVKLLLLLIGCSALLGQFARFDTQLGKLSWYEPLMALFIGSAVVFWPLHASQWRKILSSRLCWAMGSFFLWILVTTIINSRRLESVDLFITGSAYLARLLLFVSFALSIWKLVHQKILLAPQLMKGVQWWLVAQAAIGLGQYLLFPDTRMLAWLGWDDHLSRSFGTLLDPGFFGLLMALGALSFLPSLRSAPQKHWPVLGLSLCLLALATSFSRSSYLAYIGGVSLFAWLDRQRRWLLFIPLLIGALVLVPKDGGGEGQNLARTSTVAMRSEVAQIHTKNLNWREWLIGRGWYYESAQRLHQEALGVADSDLPTHSQAVDNSFLHIFLSTGLIGSGFFLWILWEVWRLKILKTSHVVFLGAVAVHALFSLSLFYPWTLLVLTFLLVHKR